MYDAHVCSIYCTIPHFTSTSLLRLFSTSLILCSNYRVWKSNSNQLGGGLRDERRDGERPSELSKPI